MRLGAASKHLAFELASISNKPGWALKATALTFIGNRSFTSRSSFLRWALLLILPSADFVVQNLQVGCPGCRFDCAGPVYFDLEIICSTSFDSSLRNWEWHKGKKHRHQHLNLNLLLPKPVDA